MKIYLKNQKSNLTKHLQELMPREVMVYDKRQLKENVHFIAIRTTVPLNDLDLRCLFDYYIFPDSILQFQSEWKLKNRTMQVGDTIAQLVFIPPTPIWSQKIIFGVRIKEIIEEQNRKGFSYETLVGHVEKGISQFTVEQHEHQIIFKIHTFSKPGNVLTRLMGPFFTLPYQRYCTNQALKNVKRQLEL